MESWKEIVDKYLKIDQDTDGALFYVPDESWLPEKSESERWEVWVSGGGDRILHWCAPPYYHPEFEKYMPGQEYYDVSNGKCTQCGELVPPLVEFYFKAHS